MMLSVAVNLWAAADNGADHAAGHTVDHLRDELDPVHLARGRGTGIATARHGQLAAQLSALQASTQRGATSGTATRAAGG